MKICELLQEAVGGQYLYHGVPDGKTMMKILKSGALKPQPAFDFDRGSDDEDNPDPDRISLTRNQYLHFPYGYGVAQIVINKDALRTAGYKVTPAVGAMMHPKYETEERVFKPIPMKAPFVVEIQYDPDLEIPKTVFNQFKKAGIKVTPWRKAGQNPAVQKKIHSPEPQNTYTDIKKLKINNNSYTYGDPPKKVEATEWYIGYDEGSGSTRLIGPKSKDKNYITTLYKKIKERVAQGLTFHDLLPAEQYGKKWDKGYYQIYPKDPEWKEPTQ